VRVGTGRRWAGVALSLALLAGCTGGRSRPTVKLQCCRDVIMTPSQVLIALRQKCTAESGRVTLDLALSDIRRTFPCSTILASANIADTALAASVAHNHDAARRVDRVRALQGRLGVPPLPRTEFVWSLGTLVAQPLNCVHAADVTYERSQLSEAIRSGDTAVHWLTVEAPLVGGYCPDRLPALYRSMAAAGQPRAAEQVQAEMPPQVSS
jgi:hypothetical protein